MTKRMAALVGILLMVASFSLADETEKTDEVVSMKGEVLDLQCYASRGAKGEEHASCAARCISRGTPAGFLAESGDVFILIKSGDVEVKDMVEGKVGVAVVAKGKVADEHGVKVLYVSSIESNDS